MRLLLLPFLLLPLPVLGTARGQDFGEPETPDLTGIWHSEVEDVVIRRTGAVSWLGSPTEGRGEAAGISWHFQHIGGEEFQFWIMLSGKATTSKLVDEKIELTGSSDEITLDVPDRKGKRRRIRLVKHYAKVPDRIGELVVTFVPRRGDRLEPDQDVDIRLVRALERAVRFGREGDPDLRRINVSATIDRNLGHSRKHHRLIRGALTIDKVNGATGGNWREDVERKLEALEAGESPDVNPRTDYAKHVTALVLGLLMEEEIDEVVCPAVLDPKVRAYLEWWVERYGRQLPTRAPSILGWRKKWDAMKKSTGDKGERIKDYLHVAVRGREKDACRHKRSKDKRYDRK